MKLYIFEKRIFAKEVLSKLSVEELQECDFITTQSLGLFKYSSPKLKFKDIPSTPTHENIQFDYETHKHGFFVRDHLEDEEPSMRDFDYLYKLKERPYDEIIIITDSDALGDFTGYQLAKQFTAFKFAELYRSRIYSLQITEFRSAMRDKVLLEDKGEKASFPHEAKRVFDFWWRVNSEKVFGELCHTVGLKNEYPISKYEIMTLNYCFSSDKDLKEFDIISWMENPKVRNSASLKYKGIKATVGSSTTNSLIVYRLLERGALKKSNDGVITVTKEGVDFIYGLHPRVFDQDLPFRLALWCQRAKLERSVVHAEMARYIKQVFGRQLRYQRKRSK